MLGMLRMLSHLQQVSCSYQHAYTWSWPGFQPLLCQSSANVKFHFVIACLHSSIWTRNLWEAGAISCYPFILCHIIIVITIIITIMHNNTLLLIINLLCQIIQSGPLSWVVYFCAIFHFLFLFGQYL